MISYSRSSHLTTSHRMIGQFKFEIRKLADGFEILRKNRIMAAELQYDNVKALVIWRVRRLVVAVRAWNNWARNKRERRCMILKARGEGQRGIKERACRYWLAIAAAVSEHDQSVRIKALVVRAAKKWKSLVSRNRYLRERGGWNQRSVELFNTDRSALRLEENSRGELVQNLEKTTPTSISLTLPSLLSERTLRTQSTNDNGKDKEKTFDLLRAKPRLLSVDSYPRNHFSQIKMSPTAKSHSLSSPSDQRIDEEIEIPKGDINEIREIKRDQIKVNSDKNINVKKQKEIYNTNSQPISESSRLGLAYSMPRVLRPTQDYSGLKINDSLKFTELNKKDLNVPFRNLEKGKREEKEKEIAEEKTLLAQEIIEFITEMRNLEELSFASS